MYFNENRSAQICSLTLIRAGFLVDQNSGGGGGKCPPRFLGGYGLIFHPNESNMVSNESWDLYQPKESLNTLL